MKSKISLFCDLKGVFIPITHLSLMVQLLLLFDQIQYLNTTINVTRCILYLK